MKQNPLKFPFTNFYNVVGTELSYIKWENENRVDHFEVPSFLYRGYENAGEAR